MVAIPQEEYMKLTSVQQVRQPYTQQFYNLERQYGEQEHIRDPYQRMVMQSETLEDMKDLKEKMRQDLTLATPKPFQSRALALYQSLQPFIKFNERGEIYNNDGQLVPQSRLEDLVQYAVRDRRRTVIPTGWSQFRNLLQSQNVPKFMLNRDTLQELTKVNVKTEPTSPVKIKLPSEGADSLTSSTPERGRKRERSRSALRKVKKQKGRSKSTSIRQTRSQTKTANAKQSKNFDFVEHY